MRLIKQWMDRHREIQRAVDELDAVMRGQLELGITDETDAYLEANGRMDRAVCGAPWPLRFGALYRRGRGSGEADEREGGVG